MSTRKQATKQPKFDEEFLTGIILANSRLSTEEARPLANTILTEAHRILGRRGGQTTKKKYGPEHYSRIGKMGGRPKLEKPNGAEE